MLFNAWTIYSVFLRWAVNFRGSFSVKRLHFKFETHKYPATLQQWKYIVCQDCGGARSVLMVFSEKNRTTFKNSIIYVILNWWFKKLISESTKADFLKDFVSIWRLVFYFIISFCSKLKHINDSVFLNLFWIVCVKKFTKRQTCIWIPPSVQLAMSRTSFNNSEATCQGCQGCLPSPIFIKRIKDKNGN